MLQHSAGPFFLPLLSSEDVLLLTRQKEQQMLMEEDQVFGIPLVNSILGVAKARNDSIAVDEACKDGIRIRYLIGHLHFLLQAIKEGVNVKGYYAWMGCE
ncbi:unnamed protein product [Sphenostylis stenocarpa]|uniref:Uncharacterized protein n=1 Tax=Sphenostylis stenocarpa TaxID=92480 RepID=A0AA86SH85_9FABA|nr:unnamed protein product [Sphenostylis stenocarpa]